MSKTERIKQLFREWDSDGSGSISRDELHKVMAGLDSGWTDMKTDAIIEAVDKNADGILQYDEFVDWVTGDSTATLSRYTGADLAQALMPEARPMEGAKSLGDIRWQMEVNVPPRYLQRRTSVGDTHRRAVTFQQLQELGALIQEVLTKIHVVDPRNASNVSWQSVNLYHINEMFVMPLTLAFLCSFMEIVADGPQDPLWFVSHWWGTPFSDSLRMLQFHIQCRGLEPTDCYWVCTFANNQHNLAELAEPDVLATPFAKAIMSQSCKGTVALLDETMATPFSRIWCVLEDYITVTAAAEKVPEPQLFDLATVIPEDEFYNIDIKQSKDHHERCVGLLTDSGDGSFEDQGSDLGFDEFREYIAWFPASVAQRGVRLDITTADASVPSDKKNILRLIGNKAEEINHIMRSKFVEIALYNAAALTGNAEEVQRLLGSGLFLNQAKLHEELLPNVVGDTIMNPFVPERTDFHKVLDLLFQARADPNAVNPYGGQLPIAIAQNYKGRANCHALVQLLEARADPHKGIGTRRGLSVPVTNPEFLQILKSYGFQEPRADSYPLESEPESDASECSGD